MRKTFSIVSIRGTDNGDAHRNEVYVYGRKVRSTSCQVTLARFNTVYWDSPIHDRIKQKIVESNEQDTIHIFRTMHNTARVFKNKVSKEVVEIERRPGSKFEDVRELVSGARGRKVYELGDPDYGIWSAGLVVGLIHDIPTCEELLGRMEKEAEEMINVRLREMVKAKL